MNAITLENISKSFKEAEALKDINIDVPEGSLFGLIGPDGAGKTTLFRILTTLLVADSGHATIAGLDITKDYRKIRQIVGYMPGKFSLYQDLTVEENLNFFATIFGTTVKENYHLIKDIYVQIEPFKKRRAGALSGGMKQKLALSCALIHRPEVLFLDEPTTGVDAVSRKEFWDMLKELQQTGLTIFVSTPYMDEAELCDKIALIQNGSILSIDTPKDIVSTYNHPMLEVKSNDLYKLMTDLRTHSETIHVFPFGEYLHLTTKSDLEPEVLFHFLEKKGHTEIKIRPAQPTIEDCFMDLMQQPA